MYMDHNERREAEKKLSDMVPDALETLARAMRHGKYPTAISAAKSILNRTGFLEGTKVEMAIGPRDLSELSDEELEAEAQEIEARIASVKALMTPEERVAFEAQQPIALLEATHVSSLVRRAPIEQSVAVGSGGPSGHRAPQPVPCEESTEHAPAPLEIEGDDEVAETSGVEPAETKDERIKRQLAYKPYPIRSDEDATKLMLKMVPFGHRGLL
jgi:hypothetical protein